MNPELDDEIGVLAGHLHAVTARFVDMVTAFDDSAAWADGGMRSCAHWLTIATGVDLWNAREMLRVGHALRELPLLHGAFAAGRLSFDKMRKLTLVASADDEAFWLDLAIEASGAQLATICRQYRRSIAMDDPARAELQRARRRVVSWWLDEDGMLALFATLPPEEGRLVLTAIESAVVRPVAIAVDVENDACAEDPAEHPHGALRADALVRICEGWLHGVASAAARAGDVLPDDAAAEVQTGAARGGIEGPTRRARRELVVHVDLDTLTGVDAAGRCHLEDGPAISVAAARRIGCDGDVVAVLERDGVPLDVGRTRRLVSGRMRRLLQLRDQGCRYPGCGVPVEDTDAHHVVHWVDGGLTEPANLVSLCRFHHHRHHDGAFRIFGDRDVAGRAAFRFETADGRPIAVRTTAVNEDGDRGGGETRTAGWPRGTAITARTAAAGWGGGTYDLDHTVLVLAGNIANAARRRAEQPAGP